MARARFETFSRTAKPPREILQIAFARVKAACNGRSDIRKLALGLVLL